MLAVCFLFLFLTEDSHEEEVSCLGGMEDSLQSATRPGVVGR